jgi:hypothetical protein
MKTKGRVSMALGKAGMLLIIKEIHVESRKVVENKILIGKAEGRRLLEPEFT